MLLGIVIDDRGLVPEADVQRLAEFGAALNRQFEKVLGTTHGKGKSLTIDFESPEKVNYIVIQEDISKGERVRGYQLSGKVNGAWKFLEEGSCIGHKRIVTIDKENLSGIKLKITSSVGKPVIKTLKAY